MSAVQLSFTVRTSPNCKTVHLIGNWDGYKGQLPLSKEGSKPGAWKGTFRFSNATLSPGTRYWYYYIMDGHHVSHDPARPFTTEPTTGRKLNILDVPDAAQPRERPPDPGRAAGGSNRRSTATIPKGRPISPSRIVSPKPVKMQSPVENLTRQVASVNIRADSESDSDIDSDSGNSSNGGRSDSGSDVPSLSSSRSTASTSSSPRTRGSDCSSPNSDTSKGSACSCNRYGITRKGERVLLDCGGKICGAGSESCSSSDSESDKQAARDNHSATRRHGVVVRNPRR